MDGRKEVVRGVKTDAAVREGRVSGVSRTARVREKGR